MHATTRRRFFGLLTVLGVSGCVGNGSRVELSAKPRRTAMLDRAMLDSGRVRYHHADYQMNETAHFILSLCEGSFTVEEIAGELASRFDVDQQSAEADVSACLQALRDRGLVS